MAIPNREQQQRKDLAVLWTQAQPHVAAFVSSMVLDFHAAEDLIQQVAVAVAEQFEDYDPARPFVPWSIGIARFKVYNYYRKVKRDKHVFDTEAMDGIARACSELEPELDMRKQALDTCVKRVQGRAATVLEMRYLREMKPARIAQKTGMTANAVSVMLHRIRAALQKCIEHELASDRRGDAP
ncbi:MAG: sigma-70 family RNA polymerase sigma factor [Phycisphaerales bacterium JB063]